MYKWAVWLLLHAGWARMFSVQVFVRFLDLALDENMYLSSPCEKTSKPGRIRTSRHHYSTEVKVRNYCPIGGWWNTVKVQNTRMSVSGFNTNISIFRVTVHGAAPAKKRYLVVDRTVWTSLLLRLHACDSHSAGVVIFLEFCLNKCQSRLGT